MGQARGKGPETMGTWSLLEGRPPNPMPGPTLSELKGSVRPRPHSKMVTDPDGSPLFPALLGLQRHPPHSCPPCSVWLSSSLLFWCTSAPCPKLSPILFSEAAQVLPGSQKSPLSRVIASLPINLCPPLQVARSESQGLAALSCPPTQPHSIPRP